MINDIPFTFVIAIIKPCYYSEANTGARPTSDISAVLKIHWKFVMRLFITYAAEHKAIFHTSRECNWVRHKESIVS